jgi:hypothetical protein
MNSVRSTLVSSFATVFAFVFIGGAALADPLGDVKNAAVSTMNARSYHFTMTSPAMGNVVGDMQFPVTLHESMSNGMEMIVMPSATYMKLHGKWAKMSSGGNSAFGAVNSAAAIAKINPASYHVGDLGMRNFGGSMMHAYSVSSLGKNGTHTDGIDYVDGSGRLAGFSIDKMVMHLTNFGESVHIAAPI